MLKIALSRDFAFSGIWARKVERICPPIFRQMSARRSSETAHFRIDYGQWNHPLALTRKPRSLNGTRPPPLIPRLMTCYQNETCDDDRHCPLIGPEPAKISCLWAGSQKPNLNYVVPIKLTTIWNPRIEVSLQTLENRIISVIVQWNLIFTCWNKSPWNDVLICQSIGFRG